MPNMFKALGFIPCTATEQNIRLFRRKQVDIHGPGGGRASVAMCSKAAQPSQRAVH